MNEASLIEPHNREIPIGDKVQAKKRKLITGSTVINFLFCLGLYLTLIQQLPLIRDVAYAEIRWVLYVIFGSLSVYCFVFYRFSEMPRMTRIFLLSIYSEVALFFMFHILNKGSIPSAYYKDIIERLIPFGILIISTSVVYSRKQLLVLIEVYCFMASIMGVSLVSYYGEVWIVSARYFLEAKNQIGPIVAISCIASFLILISERKNIHFIIRMIMFLCFGVSFFVLLMIRSRNALLSVLVIVFINTVRILLTRRKTAKEYITLMFLVLAIGIAGFSGKLNFIIKPVYESFTLNYDIRDIESISAGRISVYKESLDYIKQQPLIGNVLAFKQYEKMPHNYLLNKLVKYGILGSLPMSLFYLYLWVYVLIKIGKGKSYKKTFISYSIFIFFMSLMFSLFEYSSPYGPGVSQVLVWFLLGQYLVYDNSLI